MTTLPELPETLRSLGFRLNDEIAWRKHDLQLVFDHLNAENIAVLGGEAWVVRNITDCAATDPTELIHNLDEQRSNRGTVLAKTTSHVVYAIFPGLNGQQILFSWECSDRIEGQSWADYSANTIRETAQAVIAANLEDGVIGEYADAIYYALEMAEEK